MLNSLKSLPKETTAGYGLIIQLKFLPTNARLQAINLTEILTENSSVIDYESN